MQPKADIKWFELFYDILIVVGISNVIFMVYDNLAQDKFHVLLKALIIILILFSAWIKIVFFENKIKVLEIKLDEPICGYKLPIMIQFFLIFTLIFLFTTEQQFTVSVILVNFFLIELSNRLLYDFSILHTLSVLALLILSLIGVNYILVEFLFLAYIVIDVIVTYFKLEHISNSIFRNSKFKPPIKFNNCNTKLPKMDLCLGKIYVPHLMERMGIIMIVFMAEYVLVMLDVSKKAVNPFLTAILLFLYLLFFYMDFFSILEHYDERLLNIEDKKRKYPKAKRTIYISTLYYISLLLMSIFIKDMHVLKHGAVTLGAGFLSYVLFEVSNLILLNMYNDINQGHKIYYYGLKVVGFIPIVVALFISSAMILLVAIVFAMILNVVASKYNAVQHSFN